MEKLTDIEQLRNKAREYIADYLADPSNEAESVRGMTQLEYNSLLMHLGRCLFPFADVLHIGGDINKPYNYILIDDLIGLYTEISAKYNKVVSVVGFSYFINVKASNIYNMNMDKSYILDIQVVDSKVLQAKYIGVTVADVVGQLTAVREDSLKNRLIQTGNAVGLLGVGNNEYLWDSSTQIRGDVARVKALAELPQFGGKMSIE